MSAIRYSGNVRIRVTYHDGHGGTYADGTPRHPNGFYRCALTAFAPGSDAAIDTSGEAIKVREVRTVKATARMIVGAPAFLSEAVDSPEAYDSAASAALSFVSEEFPSDGWETHAAFKPDGSGWHVARSPREAYPRESAGEVSILSIDAWRNPEGWDWNMWYKVGTCDVTMCDRSPREILRFMREHGYLTATSRGKVTIEDDGYNVVIKAKGTRKPLFAIAYGEVRS